MTRRIAIMVLLVEDRNQENLLRKYLRHLQYDTRNLRVERVVHGAGAGEQFVRDRFAKEVRKIRARLHKAAACLIAMIDADTGSTANRHSQLQAALGESGEPAIAPDEPILVLVPKRNVETWLLCLAGEAVDEQTNYRHDQRVASAAAGAAAQALYAWTRTNAVIPANTVRSLSESLPDFRRIPERN